MLGQQIANRTDCTPGRLRQPTRMTSLQPPTLMVPCHALCQVPWCPDPTSTLTAMRANRRRTRDLGGGMWYLRGEYVVKAVPSDRQPSGGIDETQHGCLLLHLLLMQLGDSIEK